MGKFIKPGKVVIILAGRYAGKKAVIVKAYDEGARDRAFPHALVAGIDKAPLKVTKSMSKKRILKRSKVKPFIKFVNYNHIMPTRYQVDIDVRKVINPSDMKKVEARTESKKEIKKLFETKYVEREGKNQTGAQYFFQKLRF